MASLGILSSMRKRKALTVLPLDSWGNIVVNLYDNPRKVFMLLCAVKGLQLDDAWWKKFWERHRLYNEARHWRPHFYLNYDIRNPALCKVVLRLVYGMFCSKCGCRYHHRIFHPYRMRLCQECVQDHHISNVVLWHEYGVSLEEIARDMRYLVRHTRMQIYKRPKEMTHITRHPLDLKFTPGQKLAFFWLPDLRRLIDLDTRREIQKTRLAAVSHLKAVIKRCFAQHQPRRYFVEYLHLNEMNRQTNPLSMQLHTVGTNWNLAYLTYKKGHKEPKAPELSVDLALRPSLPLHLLADNEYMVNTMVSKLNLDLPAAKAKIEELANGKPLALILNKVFKC